MVYHHIVIKQCAFVYVGPENMTMGCPQPSANSKLIWVSSHSKINQLESGLLGYHVTYITKMHLGGINLAPYMIDSRPEFTNLMKTHHLDKVRVWKMGFSSWYILEILYSYVNEYISRLLRCLTWELRNSTHIIFVNILRWWTSQTKYIEHSSIP